MGKTAAERKREQRERMKASGRYQNFKENESRKQKERRVQKKNKMTVEEKETLRIKKREEMRKYRAKKAITLLKTEHTQTSVSFSLKNFFKRPHSFGKAVAKVKRNLPKSPKKSKAVIKKLAHQLLPDILQPPPPKSRITKLDENVKLQVEAFFNKDSITYQAPGTKDFVIIKDLHGKKLKVQKRYLCMTLGEAYENFKNDNCEIQIGRSKFCEYRPPYICLRHETPPNLCLCIYHENVRLILEGMSFFPTCTSDLVKLVICEENKEKCYYQTCEHCGSLKKLQNLIENLESDLEEEVKFFQWMKDETNVVGKQKLCLSLNEAIEKLKEKLPQFLQHVYIKQQQELFFENLKENLKANTLLLHFDFSENYSFFSQDEIQSAHWVSTSCTIYTAMAYFIYDNALRSVPLVVVSNYLHHDKYAVTIFNNAIIEKIKNEFSQLMISKIVYKSDGAAQHFKQKYSICLAMLQPGEVEWHFTATGHGKGPVDGVGGIMKRRIREATLSRKINPGNAEEFFESAKTICKNVTLLYISEKEIQEKKHYLDQLCSPTGNEIFSIPNTRKLHCFMKVKDYIVMAANVSLNPKEFVKINQQTGEIRTELFEMREPFEINVGNWILVPFPGKRKVKYFAGQVIDKEKLSIKVKFLQKKGNSFTWPSKDNISHVDIDINIQKLPEPNFDRRIYVTFEKFDFSNYVMG